MNQKDDPLWSELLARSAREFPRFEWRFGQCPVCHQGATDLFVLTTVTWAACFLCAMRWPVGVDVLAPRDGDDALMESNVHELAQLTQLHEEETPTMKITPQPQQPATGPRYDFELD